MYPKVTERTLYSPICQFLTSEGVASAQETELAGYPDVVFKLNNKDYLLEVKIGEQSLLEGVAQLERNSHALKTDQKILLVYPPSVRVPLADKYDEKVEKLSLDTALIYAGLFTDNLTEVVKAKTARAVLRDLIHVVVTDKRIYHPNAAIETLRDGVIILSEQLRRISEVQRIENEVAGKLDLFSAIGNQGAEAEFRTAAVDLSSYILINQILFYRIFSERTNRTSSLSNISTVSDIRERFSEIQSIDFLPIFRVNILDLLPNKEVITKTLLNIVWAIASLKPERLEHDLMGRLFHDLLPPQTRKILAAFYTRPVAAEILSYLTIDKSDETVIDPACGSGTLLIAAYHRKQTLLTGQDDYHHRFVENDITGVDIMPFATHLSAVNLASQNVDVITNNLRIGTHDSLKLKSGMSLKTFERQLDFFSEDAKLSSVEVAENSGNENPSFDVNKSDVLLMNPPFTKTKRLPASYRQEIQNIWGHIAGNSVGLWGYFIFLSDMLIKNGGKMGAIIPINLLRGRDSHNIRKNFLSGRYKWKYIVRATKNYAFSESSEYADILWVVQKRKSDPKDLVAIVLIKEDISKMAIEEARNLAIQMASIKSGENYSGKDFDLFWESHEKLLKMSDNLMPLVTVSNLTTKKLFQTFLDKAENDGKVELFTNDLFSEGFRPVPEGLSELIYITNNVTPSRLENATLDLIDDKEGNIKAKITEIDLRIEVEKDFTVRSMRTPVGLPTMDVTDNPDYLILAPYEGYEEVKNLSKFKGDPDWKKIKENALSTETEMAICRRLNPYSPSQYFIAFYSQKPMYPSNQMELVKYKGDDAKIMTLFFNSIYFLIQFFIYKEESTGRRVDIRVSDLVCMKGLKLDKLKDEDKKSLLDIFGTLSKKTFPSLLEQLQTRDPNRMKIDKVVLMVLGFTEQEAENAINELYPALVSEMERIKSFARD